MGTPVFITIVGGILLLGLAFYIIARKSEGKPYHQDPSAWLQPPAPAEPELPPANTVAPDYQEQVNQFESVRTELQDSFFQICSESGRPRGLRWNNCDFEEDVTLVIEKHSLNLHGFIPVVISFEAIPGGPMEDMEAVSNLRVGSALFVHTGENWATRGDVIYNLTPAEAIAHYRENYTDFDVVTMAAAIGQKTSDTL